MSELPPIRTSPGETANIPALRLAVQEALLTGTDEGERIQQAERLGVAGIEYNANGLAERVMDICAALEDTPLTAATVHLGWDANFVATEERVRQQALDQLRHAMTDAVDIGAGGVVLVPHTGATLGLPDLMPLKAPIQIAVELMTLHLRTLSDLAYVFGIKLYLQPVNRYVSAFLNHLEQGVELRRRIKFSEHVLLAADTYHMSMTEDNPLEALEDASQSIGHLYLVEHNGRLPGTGVVDFATVRETLTDMVGWAVLTHYTTEADRPRPLALKRSVTHLQEAGF
ncbi:MAG: sugar phosphate isomerase/epimerase family protein [Chloroflexota bacterium]